MLTAGDIGDLGDHIRDKENPHEVTAAQAGAFRKEESLSDGTRSLYGLGANAMPDAVHRASASLSNLVWQKLVSYEKAGAYTWTAPDLFHGQGYMIGVMIIGGGAGGGVSVVSGNTHTQAQGGASGFTQYFTLMIEPGRNFPVVVGGGGVAAVVGVGTTKQLAGNGGGSSSFDGIVAEGGAPYQSGSRPRFFGAQEATNGGRGDGFFGGLILGADNSVTGGVRAIPTMCINPFEGKRIMASGGGAASYHEHFHPGGKDPISKLGGGDGVSSDSPKHVKGENASENGCGGGPACVRLGGKVLGEGDEARHDGWDKAPECRDPAGAVRLCCTVWRRSKMDHKITAGTIARTIILLLALANQLLDIFGLSPRPIADAQIETVVSTGATVIVAVAAWWKNNSFTTAAKAGDQVMREERG